MLDEDDPQPLGFIGSATLADGVQARVSSIRATLDLALEDLRQAHNTDQAFGLLTSHADEAGIFVLLLGNLGSCHTNVDLDTFRGFALADEIAPFDIINDQDHQAAWSFTLLHELTHLWLGQTGMSGGAAEREVEEFCNDVASDFLLPSQELDQLEVIGSADSADRPLRMAAWSLLMLHPRRVTLRWSGIAW